MSGPFLMRGMPVANAIWSAGRFQLGLRVPLVMGIVNVTPDSFSDGGQHAGTGAAIAHARRLLDEGADILDVGGESTRPGATPLDADAEWLRIQPVLEELLRWQRPVSVDTYHPENMRRALAMGVDIVNDIQALRLGDAARIVADSPAGICLMHMQGEPGTMQQAPHYDDVVAEVDAFLTSRVEVLMGLGVAAARVCLDPGFGFGKTFEHNLALARGLPRIVAQGFPVLVGVSRKSMLGAAVSRPPQERLAASLAAALACVAAGARIVRVHDVAQTVDAVKVWTAMTSGDE